MCVLSFLISLLINIVLSTPLNTPWPPQSTTGSYSTGGSSSIKFVKEYCHTTHLPTN